MYGNAADHPDRLRRYPSDMTDAESAALRPLPPMRPGSRGGADGRRATAVGSCWTRPATWSRAESLAAMPADFPTWVRVNAFFGRWREHGLIAEFHGRPRGTVREREVREAEPTAGIIAARSVRAAATVPASQSRWDMCPNGTSRRMLATMKATEPAHPTQDRRRRKAQQTRNALACAAVELILERGLAATTVEAIVEEADVTRRTFEAGTSPARRTRPWTSFGVTATASTTCCASGPPGSRRCSHTGGRCARGSPTRRTRRIICGPGCGGC